MFTLTLKSPPGGLHDHRGVAGGLVEHHVAERDDQPGLLRDPDEHVRGYVDAVGLPAGQRLDAGDVAGGGAHDRLVDEREVAGGHRGAQRLDELEALEPRAADGAFVLHPLVLAARLGLVHREVGVAQHALGGLAAVAERDADARGQRELVAGDVRAAAERASRIRSQARADLGRVDVLEQQRELVAAEPGDGVALPHAARVSRWATSISTASPAAWPNRSLTGLKPSRSTNSSAMRVPRRRDICSACSTRSSSRPRLGRLVSRSWRARWVMSSVSRSRAKASEETATIASRACWSAVVVDRARCWPGATIQRSRWPSRSWAPISWAPGGVARTSTCWIRSSRRASSVSASTTCRVSESVWARTAASNSTLSRRAFSLPRVTARVATSRVASGTASSSSVHHGGRAADHGAEVAQGVEGHEAGDRDERAALHQVARAAGSSVSMATETAESRKSVAK